MHRDLKPENIFVDRDGRVRILDFGLAKLTQAEARRPGASSRCRRRRRTRSPAMVLGTVGYMAPEQVRGLPGRSSRRTSSRSAPCYTRCLSGSRAFLGETTMRRDDRDSQGRSARPALCRTAHSAGAGAPRRSVSARRARPRVSSPRGTLRCPGGLVFAVRERDGDRPPSRCEDHGVALGMVDCRALLTGVLFWQALPFAIAHLRERPFQPGAVRFAVAPLDDAMRSQEATALFPGTDGICLDRPASGVPGSAAGSADLLWVRSLDALEAQPLPGTEGGNRPSSGRPTAASSGSSPRAGSRKSRPRVGPSQAL